MKIQPLLFVGMLLFLFMLSSGLAIREDFTTQQGVIPSWTAFPVGQSFNVTNATGLIIQGSFKMPLSGATHCYLFSGDGACDLLAIGTNYDNDYCDFNQSTEFAFNDKFWIVADADGSIVDGGFGPNPSGPETTNNFFVETGQGFDCSAGDTVMRILLGVNWTSPSNPPVIDEATYNMTTATQNNTAWRQDTTFAIPTTDSTDTIKFDTDINSLCRCNTQDQNWTTMGDDRNASTTGGTSHVCTIGAADKFTTSGFHELFIACTDTSTMLLMSPNSTSGSLNISLSISPITWDENLTNFTGNHNASIIYNTDLNASDSVECTVDSYFSNDTNWPINSANGVVSIAGPNITKAGLYDVDLTANDSCTNIISQVITLNITNIVPICQPTARVSVLFNTNATQQLSCTDPDNDELFYADNTTDFDINTSGFVNFNVTFLGFRHYNLSGNDSVGATYQLWKVGGRTLNNTVALFFDNLFGDIDVELNTTINITAIRNETVNGTICIDINHPDYGVNYTCETNRTSISFNISYFNQSGFNDSSSSQVLEYSGVQNNTAYVSAHQYDEVVRLNINLTGISASGGFPQGVRVFLNDTFILAIGEVTDATNFTLSTFNDSLTEKILNYSVPGTQTAGFFRVPKTANITDFTMTMTGIENETIQEDAQVNVILASFEDGGLLYVNYTKLVVSESNVLWRVKHGAIDTLLSIPTDCWSTNETIAVLRMQARHQDGTSKTQISRAQCWDNSTWVQLSISSNVCSNCAGGSSSSNNLFDGSFSTGAAYNVVTGSWQSGTATGSRVYEEHIIWTIFPRNLWAEVGFINSSRDWEFALELNASDVTSNMSAKANAFLSTCTADASGFCEIPLFIFSEGGNLNVSNITLSYTYTVNPVVLNITLVEQFLFSQTNETVIPIVIESNGGNLTVDALQYYYAGGNQTHVVIAHSPDRIVTQTANITTFYSRWNSTLPNNVDFLEFIPQKVTSKNVTPFGQTPNRPILNISNWAYGNRDFNYSIFVNQTDTCVNISMGNSSNRSLATEFNTVQWNDLHLNSPYQEQFGIWMWADFECNQTAWRLWDPYQSERACAVGTTCSNFTGLA